MRLVIRCDASDLIGAGHTMRCLSIAEESTSREIPTYLIGKVERIPWLRDKVVSIPNLIWLEDSSAFVPNSATDTLIVDSYTISTLDDFIDAAKWYRVISIVDEKTPIYNANIRIHPGLDISWSKDTEIVYGPKYIPIRKNIYKNTRVENEMLHVIVVGGATNYRNFVEVIASELKGFDLDFRIHLFGAIEGQSKYGDWRFSYEPIGNRLDYLAEKSDLIITTSSTTSLEFVAREMAMGIFCAIDNQNTYYEALSKLGLACPLGKFVGENWEIDTKLLRKLVYSKDYRSIFKARTKGFIDLLGSVRILDMILAEYD